MQLETFRKVFQDRQEKLEKEKRDEAFGKGCSLAAFFVLSPLMFQYILWSIFAQDVVWWVDVVAGLLLSKYRLPQIFALCLVLRHCDYSVPLFKSVKAALGY